MSINPACRHRVANHEHGTRACYTLDGCRCPECAEARRSYDRIYDLRKKGLIPDTTVDAAPVRAHVTLLLAGGMSLKRIALVSGVAHGTLSKLIYGIPKISRPPSKRVHQETAARVYACPYTVADGAKVDRAEFDMLLDELLARGWSRVQVAKRISGIQARSLQVGKCGGVTAGMIRATRRLLFAPVPNRFHGPTGRWMTPRGRAPDLVDADTLGVPDEPDIADKRRQFQLVLDRAGLHHALQMAQERNARTLASRDWIETLNGVRAP